MHAERFRALLTADGPFASVYFDDSHNTPHADTQLELKWRNLHEQLDQKAGPRPRRRSRPLCSAQGRRWAAAVAA
jgi:hypothetical protein